jgi:hypothetical protein
MIQALSDHFLNFLYRQKLRSVLRALERTSHMPHHCEMAAENGFYATNYLPQNQEPGIISFGAGAGFSNLSELSKLKAICEWIERAAMKDAALRYPHRFAHGSDGCAAYPVYFGRANAAVSAARQIARAEAVERYVWATWWDDADVAFDRTQLPASDRVVTAYTEAIRRFMEVDKFVVVEPKIKESPFNLRIVLAFNSEGGVVTGGAASLSTDRLWIERSMSELLRHAIGYARFKGEVAKPNSMYDERLVYFASGRGKGLVADRLNAKSKEALRLPPLEWDAEVHHDMDHEVKVYQCLFEGQPDFIGGAMERLCL